MTHDLFQQHLEVARRIALGVARKTPPGVAREDLEQAALMGLHGWCSAHPDSSQPGWLAGLKVRVRGAIADWLRTEDWLPRGARAKGALGIVRLEDLGAEDGPGWQDMFGQYNDASDARLDALAALEAELPGRDRHIVVEAFASGTQYKDLAAELGVSEQRVSQLLTRAKRKMREHLERQREVVTAPPVSVQVPETPKFRIRDFRRELWLARRNALWQHMTPGMTMTALARKLGLPTVTVFNWCTSTSLSNVPLERDDTISLAMREKGKSLILAALRSTGGSGARAAPLLGMSNARLCVWRQRLIPDAPRAPRGGQVRLDHDAILEAHEQGLNNRQIASVMGNVSDTHVGNVLEKLGRRSKYQGPPRRADVTVEVCLDLDSAGRTARQIGQELGCSTALVRKRLREARAA